MAQTTALEHCPKCGKPTKMRLEFLGNSWEVPCNCDCEEQDDNNCKRDTTEQ